MSAPSAEITSKDAIVDAARDFLDSLPDKPGLETCRDEGRAVAAIIEPFGLPPDIVAAVHAYPAFRDGFIEPKTIENRELKELPRIFLGLKQLDEFSLPRHWQPGEALAVQQSEALRKMLLAVVSDVRLVLVRIADQLNRLREAKTASAAMREAIALETREIYAPLANRLGVWQLEWELEDLAFRYL